MLMNRVKAESNIWHKENNTSSAEFYLHNSFVQLLRINKSPALGKQEAILISSLTIINHFSLNLQIMICLWRRQFEQTFYGNKPEAFCLWLNFGSLTFCFLVLSKSIKIQQREMNQKSSFLINTCQNKFW